MNADVSSERRGSLGFEKQLWETADLLQGNMDPADNPRPSSSPGPAGRNRRKSRQ